MIKYFLTGGCSFTAGEHTWPNYLLETIFENRPRKHFYNLAMSGGGNSQICDNLIFCLESKKYFNSLETVIGINITELDRFDIMCPIIHPNKNPYFGWGDHDFNFNWINSTQGSLTDPSTLYKFILKNVGYEQIIISSCLSIIKLFSYLESKKYNYFFMTINDSVTDKSPDWFGNFINCRENKWVKLDDQKSMFSYCKKHNLLEDDNFHPSILGHKEIANIIKQKTNLFKTH